MQRFKDVMPGGSIRREFYAERARAIIERIGRKATATAVDNAIHSLNRSANRRKYAEALADSYSLRISYSDSGWYASLTR